ncbi:MAG: methyltransferase domain-containing protein, partial [Deferrisomatales bacterium]|nr:methyltransferase domain-containing protein [Deferrisomatales bacterium]
PHRNLHTAIWWPTRELLPARQSATSENSVFSVRSSASAQRSLRMRGPTEAGWERSGFMEAEHTKSERKCPAKNAPAHKSRILLRMAASEEHVFTKHSSALRPPVRGRELLFYDGVYTTSGSGKAKRPTSSLAREWFQPWSPQNRLVLDATLPLRGKRILILGNGISSKELHLLDYDPTVYIYSDLSAQAVQTVRDTYLWQKDGTQTYFAAIDAFELPLQDESLDIVYSYAMVHHLPDLKSFFAEVVRVLRPGGRAVFLDDAYSPLWHMFKSTLGRRLMLYTHRTKGISPEDLRFSLLGGFREEVLTSLIRDVGADPWFQRVAFTNYLWQRAAIKLITKRFHAFVLAKALARVLNGVDWLVSKTPGARRNLIRLVWGFHKTGAGV